MNHSLVFKTAGTALAVALALLPAACKRPAKVQVQEPLEEGPRLASSIPMNDSKLEPQLLNGFYPIEQGAWRWTARQFTALLKTPFGASQRGGTLDFEFNIPNVVIDKLKTVALAVSVDGKPLPPETYTQPGNYSLKRDLPGSMLAGDNVKIDFQLDKAMAPSGADLRELGVVASSLSLVSK